MVTVGNRLQNDTKKRFFSKQKIKHETAKICWQGLSKVGANESLLLNFDQRLWAERIFAEKEYYNGRRSESIINFNLVRPCHTGGDHSCYPSVADVTLGNHHLFLRERHSKIAPPRPLHYGGSIYGLVEAQGVQTLR